VRAFGYVASVAAEVVETHDLTDPSQDGWAFDYRIRRDDGEVDEGKLRRRVSYERAPE
jgi:hypothetical protein